jgi:hypothetical protein
MKHSTVRSRPKYTIRPFERLSTSYFLYQVEEVDPSGLVTSLIGILESTKAALHSNKGILDILTRECILTEFMKRTADLINGQMETCNYRLTMEERI